MNEEVAVIIPTSPDMAQAFQKIFPNAQIRRIKRKEQPPEQPQENNEPNAETPVERERLLKKIIEFCQERKSPVDAVRFFNYYDGRGWMDNNGNKITDWKRKIIAWETNGIMNRPNKSQPLNKQEDSSPEKLNKLLEDLDKL